MFELIIKTDNEVFASNDPSELSRILREAADRLERGFDNSALFDVNGNRVGSYDWTR